MELPKDAAGDITEDFMQDRIENWALQVTLVWIEQEYKQQEQDKGGQKVPVYSYSNNLCNFTEALVKGRWVGEYRDSKRESDFGVLRMP